MTLAAVTIFQFCTKSGSGHAAPSYAARLQATNDLLKAVRDIPTKHGTSDDRSLALVADALRRGADPNARYGNSPAVAAATYRWVARRLPGGIPDEDTTLEAKDRWPILLRASELGNSSVIQMLLTAGAKLHAHGEGGETALYLSSRSGSLSSTRLLLSCGADPNEKGDTGTDSSDTDPGYYPLQETMMAPETTKLLIEYGADPQRRTHGETIIAFERKMINQFRTMMEIEFRKHPGRFSPARFAAAESRSKTSLAMMDAACKRKKG